MAGANTKTFDQTTFDQAVGAGPVLVDFWAEWCGPCRALGPTIDELGDDFAGKVTVGKVNVDENQALAQRFGVSSIPTVVLLVDGKETKRFVGISPKEEYAGAINEALDAVRSA